MARMPSAQASRSTTTSWQPPSFDTKPIGCGRPRALIHLKRLSFRVSGGFPVGLGAVDLNQSPSARCVGILALVSGIVRLRSKVAGKIIPADNAAGRRCNVFFLKPDPRYHLGSPRLFCSFFI